MAEQQSRSGALEAAQDKLSLSVAGMGGVSFQITGTFSGTITFEISTDEYGLIFRTLQVASVTTGTAVTTATAAGMWTGNCAGAQIVRARMSSYSSGTALVTIRSSLASPGGGGSGGGGGGAVTIADGADVAEGATTDAAVVSDADGTVSAKLRGLIALSSPLDLDTGGGTVPVGGNYLALPGSGGPVAGGTSTNPVQVSLANTGANATPVAISAASLPLPTGAATESTLLSADGTLASIESAIGATNALLGSTLQVSVANTGANATAVKVDGSAVTQPISGTVTAAQATAANLNATVVGTGTFAVQDAAAEASLSVLDDWNESDRAKVNPIAGQAGVAGGSGNVSALTQRVVLAADVGLPAGTNNIGDVDVLTLPTTKRKQIWGTTTTTVINTATDIAAGNFSGAPAATFDNTTDATVPYAPYAQATGQFPDWAAAPVAGTAIELWGVLQDTDGTSDDTDAPSGTAVGGARYFGSFVVAAADALQRRTITIQLDGCQKINFYIKNGTAQNMNNDAGTNATVKITPFTIGTF